MANAEACDDGERVFFPHRIGGFTHNEGDLHLPVDLFLTL